MNQEIVFTSAKRGLGVGKSGFCTVASTQGMATPAVRLLESLSGYRHLHPPGSAEAKQNPVVYSHLATRVAGHPSSILSRISDAGLDYSNRSNKLAHHIVLGSPTAVAGGPTAILGNHGFFETEWSGEPRILPNRQFSGQAVPTVACNTWKQLTGHAGWAGELVDALRKKETAYIVVQPTTPAFQLISEALALLPVAERWQVSFSSFFTNLPPGIECQWRCVMAGSPEAAAARRSPRNRVIDLANLAGAPSNPYLQNAIDGQTVESVSGSRTALKLELVPQKPKPVPQPPPAPNDPAEGPPELSSPPSLDGAQAAETEEGVRTTPPGLEPGSAPSLPGRPTPAPQTVFDDFSRPRSSAWKMAFLALCAMLLIGLIGVGVFYAANLNKKTEVADEGQDTPTAPVDDNPPQNDTKKDTDPPKTKTPPKKKPPKKNPPKKGNGSNGKKIPFKFETDNVNFNALKKDEVRSFGTVTGLTDLDAIQVMNKNMSQYKDYEGGKPINGEKRCSIKKKTNKGSESEEIATVTFKPTDNKADHKYEVIVKKLTSDLLPIGFMIKVVDKQNKDLQIFLVDRKMETTRLAEQANKASPLVTKAYESIWLPSSPASGQRPSADQTWSIFGDTQYREQVEVFQLDWTDDQPIQWTVRLLNSDRAASPISEDPDDKWNPSWQINQGKTKLGTLEIKFDQGEQKYTARYKNEDRPKQLAGPDGKPKPAIAKILQIGLGLEGGPDLKTFNLPLSSLKVQPQVKSKTEFKFGLPIQVQYQKAEGSNIVPKKNARFDIELTKKVTESLDALVGKTKGYGLWKFTKPRLDSGILKFDIEWQDDGQVNEVQVKQEMKDLFKELHCELITDADGTCKFRADFFPFRKELREAQKDVDKWVNNVANQAWRDPNFKPSVLQIYAKDVVSGILIKKQAYLKKPVIGTQKWPYENGRNDALRAQDLKDVGDRVFSDHKNDPELVNAFIYNDPKYKNGLARGDLGNIPLNQVFDGLKSEVVRLGQGLSWSREIAKKKYNALVKKRKADDLPPEPSTKKAYDGFVDAAKFVEDKWAAVGQMLSSQKINRVKSKLNEQFFVIPLLVDGHPMDQNWMVQDYHLIVGGNFPKDNSGKEIKPEQIFQQTFDKNYEWFLEHVVQPRGNTAVNSGRQSGNNNRNQNGRTGSQQGRPQSGVELQGNDDPDNDQQKKDEDSD